MKLINRNTFTARKDQDIELPYNNIELKLTAERLSINHNMYMHLPRVQLKIVQKKLSN